MLKASHQERFRRLSFLVVAVAKGFFLSEKNPALGPIRPENLFQSNLPTTVDFRGSAQSPADIYRDGDVFILPARWEGLGLQLFESQAAGMPLITTDAPSMNEANTWKRLPCIPKKIRLSHDRVAFDVSPSDLAEAMKANLGADITEASRNARNWVVEHRDWTKRAVPIRTIILEG